MCGLRSMTLMQKGQKDQCQSVVVSCGYTVELTLETRVPAAELSKDRVVGLVHGTISAFEKGFGIKSPT